MRNDAQDRVVESVEAFNQGVGIYNTFVPSLTGGPQTADEMLAERMNNIKGAVSDLAEVIVAEHPPGVKIK